MGAERLNSLGMVMDFDDLRDVVKKAVLERWDHATLLWAEDPLVAAITRVQAEAPDKVVRLPANPTVEVLAREAWDAISQGLPAGVVLERVLIRETPTCSTELSVDRA